MSGMMFTPGMMQAPGMAGAPTMPAPGMYGYQSFPPAGFVNLDIDSAPGCATLDTSYAPMIGMPGAGMGMGMQQGYGQMQPQVPQSYARTETYTVQKGDTVYKIAKHFGTTMQAIIQTNNLSNPNLIYPGQVLIIA